MWVVVGEQLAPATENTLPASIMDEKAPLYSETLSTTAGSMLSIRRRAHFETTKRVLAAAVNEGMAIGTIETSATPVLLLRAPYPETDDGRWIKCGVHADAYAEKDGDRVVGFLRAEDLLTPVLTGSTPGEGSEELDPVVLCRIICDWQPESVEKGGLESLMMEVQSATDNQVKWLEIAATQPRLHLESPMADWEQSVVTGHPTHPLHKTCFAKDQMKTIVPDDVPELMSPEITFLSVPRSEITVTGPFEELIEPLLKSLGVPQVPESDRIIVPCFTRQLPCIEPSFPQARRLKSVTGSCRAQISMRSLSFKPEIGFPHFIKLSLNVQITAGLRNVRPWGAILGPMLGKMLPNLLPPTLWLFTEPASITGALEDPVQSGLISSIIRKLPEQHATHPEEILIPGAGLMQKPFNEDKCYMEILFGLDDLKKKQDWFRKYAELLFNNYMPPLVRYGIGFESHLQNVVVRVNAKTKKVSGFAVRDLEGTRIHYPTFRKNSGYELKLPARSPHLANDTRVPWNKVHHSIIQDHVAPILHTLGIESHGAWTIVREELEKSLNPSGDPDAKGLWEYFTQEQMPIPRFLGMRLLGYYKESYEAHLPNFVLRK